MALEIIAINVFFAIPFTLAGSLFRHVAHKETQQTNEG
jgi:hypothetical protein